MGWIEIIPNWILPFAGVMLYVLRKWTIWSNKSDKGLKSIPQNFNDWIFDLRQEIIWALVIATAVSGGGESTLDSIRSLCVKFLGDDWSDTLISIQVNSEKLLYVILGYLGNFMSAKIANKVKSK